MNHFPPVSSGDYLLHLEGFIFDHKACPSWSHRDGPNNDILSSSTSTQSMNLGYSSADEFHLGCARALSDGHLPLHTSIVNPNFIQVFPPQQPRPNNNLLSTNYPAHIQPQENVQPKQETSMRPTQPQLQLNTTAIAPFPLALPRHHTSQSAPKLTTPKAKPRVRKHLPPSGSPTATAKNATIAPISIVTSSSLPSPQLSLSSLAPTSPASATISTTSPQPPHRPGPIRKPRHSVTEKRYRTNLNDKIALLRDSIPSLRCNGSMSGNGKRAQTCNGRGAGRVVKQRGRGTGGASGGDGDVAGNLRKAAIFTEATAHISHLEIRNARLADECQGLRARLDAFEALFMAARSSSMDGTASAPSFMSGTPTPGASASSSPETGDFIFRW